MSRVIRRAAAVTARLDVLTDEQRHAVIDTARVGDPLTVDEANTLLAAIALPDSEYGPWRQHHPDAEQALLDHGLLRHGNPHVEINPEVLDSLHDQQQSHHSRRLRGTRPGHEPDGRQDTNVLLRTR